MPPDKPKFDYSAEYHSLRLFDEEAEMSVLGAMLLDRDVAIDLLDKLGPQDFLKESNQEVFETIRELHLQGRAVDSLTAKAELEKRGTLQRVGGYDYLLTLMEFTPITSNAQHYARIVKEKSVLRALAQACGDILGTIKESGHGVDELINLAQSKMFAITADGIQGRAAKFEDIMNETFKQLMDFRELRDRKSRLLGHSTGLFEIDDLLAGLQPSNLYVVAGRPSMGKSSLCTRIIEHVAVTGDEPKPVLLFSLEMSAQQICQGMLCSLARADSHRVRRGEIPEPMVKSLAIAAGKLSDAPIWIDDSADLGILDLRARARRMVAQHKIALVVVDYMQKVSARHAESRQIEISMISSQLKAMAKELKLPVIVAAQLNRSPEGREDKRPMLSDLRESGAIEQDADVVMLLYRDEYYHPDNQDRRGICEVTVAKNRTGPTDKVELSFIKEWTRFENLRKVEAPGA
ncbi:MAG TPA: replicative DNA helicase [Planctomycetota bacterium]|nr:replicative DNA helicase [Planctomycetota bacterium]